MSDKQSLSYRFWGACRDLLGLTEMPHPLTWFDWATVFFIAAALSLCGYGIISMMTDPQDLPSITINGGSSSERAH